MRNQGFIGYYDGNSYARIAIGFIVSILLFVLIVGGGASFFYHLWIPKTLIYWIWASPFVILLAVVVAISAGMQIIDKAEKHTWRIDGKSLHFKVDHHQRGDWRVIENRSLAIEENEDGRWLIHSFGRERVLRRYFSGRIDKFPRHRSHQVVRLRIEDGILYFE